MQTTERVNITNNNHCHDFCHIIKHFSCQELELQQQVCSSRKEDMSGSNIKYEPSMVASIPICFWSQPGTPSAHGVAGALRTAVAVWSMSNPFPRQCSTAPKADVIVVVGDCIAYLETCCSWNCKMRFIILQETGAVTTTMPWRKRDVVMKESQYQSSNWDKLGIRPDPDKLHSCRWPRNSMTTMERRVI